MLLRLVLILSLLLPIIPHADASEPSALRKGWAFIRIHLIATDSELSAVKRIIHEAEGALEAPSLEEGWRKRWEALKNPTVGLDLRRSLQNVGRLFRVSKHFQDPWERQILLTSAWTFFATHFSEVWTGVRFGSHHTIQATSYFFDQNFAAGFGELGVAIGFAGLALPGLYDLFCVVGQGMLFVRPTRNTMMLTRKVIVTAGSATGRFFRLPQFMNVIFRSRPAQAAILKAFESRGDIATIDIAIRDEDLLKFDFSKDDASFLNLMFEEKEGGELVLKSANLDVNAMKALPYEELKPLLKPFGWNAKGAIREIQKLLKRDRTDLVAEERTFVSSADLNQTGWMHVEFRQDSVHVAPSRWRLRLPSFARATNASCAQQIAEPALVK